MRANPSLLWRAILSACLLPLIAPAAQAAPADAGAIAQALDKYADARTEQQRAAVVEFLRALDRDAVTGAILDHIVAAHDGKEATLYNLLVEQFAACQGVVERMTKESDATARGKLIVALRRCNGGEVIHALTGALGDTRPFSFAAHGSTPRRICDVAYDELFLKLRADAEYGLDPSPKMAGLITEKTPLPRRDGLISALKGKLAQH